MNLLKKQILGFFTKGHERTLLAKKNIIASFGIKGISIAINLALVPLTINYVNPTQYGIWLTLSSIVAWFSFFDIGFGNGLRNRFAESKAHGDVEKARIYVSTTYAILTLIFLCVWLVFFTTNFFIDWSKILNAPKELAQELSTLSLIVFSFLCLRIIFQTINTIIVADQKPALAGFLNMAGQLLGVIIIFILTRTTQGTLINLGLALGVSPIFIFIISSFIFYNGKYKEFAPSLKNIDFSFARDIMNLGVKFFLIQFGAIVLFQTTNIVITKVLGPEKVTVYNIAYKYFSVMSMLFYIILSPFWSAFTEAYAKQEYNWMKNSIEKLKKIWLLSIPLGLIMVLLANFAYKLWIGNVINVPISVSIAMAILILLSMRFNLFILPINGMGKIRLQLYVNIAISLVYIPMAIYSCKWYGLEGIIGANILVAAIHAVISQKQITRLMTTKATGIWNK
ncbi:lipopolysaccharide biosynthesis protein [Flagellimonas marinaquae]